MNIATVEENIQKLTKNFSKKTFVYDLLIAYGVPKSSVARLKSGTGTYNLSKVTGEILWKKKLFFKEVTKGDLHDVIDDAKSNSTIMKQDPRFLIVTDWKTFLALDTKTSTTLDVELSSLNKHFDFFLPWAGLEKVSAHIENPADVKAAEKMAKLYDQIRSDNPEMDAKEVHSLNVFLSRLLFCYFAEDTGIFESGLFTSSVASHTAADGSDLDAYLNKLFEVLNTKDRKKYPQYLQLFPYVNGGLLEKKIKTPSFTAKSRKILIECGELNWSEINPDIFGSMIQAVVDSAERGSMGVHYTSVGNILKVINPLYLSSLQTEVHQNRKNAKKLDKLLVRISKIKIFDPACGSGNFLIIAYKELRKIEMLILKYTNELSGQYSLPISNLKLTQFFGIELDDFATEIARLSLWLAEHQMNLEFAKAFGSLKPALPLKDGGNIISGNACRLDWRKVCPIDFDSEIYVLGNPPYRGSSLLSQEQKEDIKIVLNQSKGYKKLDYIACWLAKGADYIKFSQFSKVAFVSTSSICQGEQVSAFWPSILTEQIEIGFAHLPFKWENQAKNNAGVSCVILSLRNKSNYEKYLFFENQVRVAQNINAYLLDYRDIYVNNRSKPLSDIPIMVYGNKPVDGGNLILQTEEKDDLIEKFPNSQKYLRELMGADEFIKGYSRWCIWLDDEDLISAFKIEPIKKRIEEVKKMRLKSVDPGANALASRPHQFRDRKVSTNSIIIPRHSSERRKYIPFGFLGNNVIVSDSAQAIYDAEPWIFGVISSRLHQIWVRSVGGQLETRIRYSSELCYNTFPFPEISEVQKKTISTNVLNILQARETNSQLSISDLYDPDKMPKELLEAHYLLDLAVERCYRVKPFLSDEERLGYLFEMYTKLNSKD